MTVFFSRGLLRDVVITNVPERSGDFFRTRDGIITQQSAEVYPMYEHARYCFCLRNIFMSQLSIAGRGCR